MKNKVDKIPHQKRPISAVVISFNAIRTIDACLEALIKVCDEVLVLDSASSDGTVEVCQRLGVRLIDQPWLGFAQTKNLGNELARHDWILSIDADEILSDALIRSLADLPLREGTVYSLDRMTDFAGKWVRHAGWYPDWKVRLFDRRQVKWQGDFVHETLHIPAGVPTVKIAGKLYHYSYQDDADHLRRIEKYAQLSARELYAKGKKTTWAKRWLSPAGRFVRTFFVKLGFLDGAIGWKISVRNAQMVRKRYQLLDELWATGQSD